MKKMKHTSLEVLVKDYPISKVIRTVCFLLKEDCILLGQKKEGIGTDKFIGIGGKVEKNELPVQTVRREVKEEILVTLKSCKLNGVAKMYFPYHANSESRSMEIYFYYSDTFIGIPSETEEIAPKWFKKNKLPYELMWDDHKYWMKYLLKTQYWEGIFVYNTNDKVEKFAIK